MAENEKEATSKEEKLNKEEFRQLIPHLDYKQLFLIQINCSDKWQGLFNVIYENKSLAKITCNACSEELQVEKFKQHIQTNTHLNALLKVEQFFHPLLTSDRRSSSPNANSETKDTTESDIQKANAIASQIKRMNRSNGGSYTSVVILPLEDLLRVKFLIKEEGNWQPLLSTKGKPHPSGKYNCVLCSKYCRGLNPLNDHLKGASHKLMQLKVHMMKVPNYDHLTKYCQLSCNLDKKLKEHDSKTDSTKKSLEKEKYIRFAKKTSTLNPGRIEVEEHPRKSVSKSKDLNPVNGLIGVEFVTQLKKSSQPGFFSYVCCLCDSEIIASAEDMEKHLTSYEHRLKYCELYYSDTIANFKRMVTDCRADLQLVLPFVLEKIALGIDQYHGYGKPHSTTEEHFKKFKNQVTKELLGLPHACQEFGPSFSNVVTAQEIRDFKKKPVAKIYDSYSENTPVRFTVRDPSKHYLNMRRHVSRSVTKHLEVSDKPSHCQTLSVKRTKRSRSPSNEQVLRKRQSSIRQQSYGSTNIWSVYRDHISKAAIELENIYVGYRKQPEKHPLYDQEWNTFWRRRKEELMLEGKNYRSYNFQPEWTTYFRQRLEQLFGEDLQKSKINVRHRLNIPIDVEEDSSPSSKYDNSSISRRIGRKNSENTWDKTLNSSCTDEDFNFVPVSQEVEKPTVIHMLRLMTALEDHLGTLGSKVLELLTKAVSLEKIYPPDSQEFEKHILTASNYKLLKTAVEKLKSKLYADLIEGNRVTSFKRVIKCTEIILKRAEEMGWANETELNVINESTHIQQLIEVLQEKKAISPSLGKKSLSDALMEVMSQKKVKELPISLGGSSLLVRKHSSQFDNIPSRCYSGMQSRNNISDYTPNIRSDLLNRNSENARGHGNINMNLNNQYESGVFGYMNPQWPISNTQYSYSPQNFGSNSGFMGVQSNVSNNSNWME